MIGMKQENELEEVRKLFKNDRFATENGAVIEVKDELGNLSALVSTTGYRKIVSMSVTGECKP